MRNWRVSGLLSAAQWTQDYKLASSRYAVARDLKGVTARELARDVCVSEEDAKLILDFVLGTDVSLVKEGAVEQSSGPLPGLSGDGRGCTLFALLKQEQELGSIVTFCAQVDDILGIAVGHIYYFLEDVFPNKPGGFRILKTPWVLQYLFDAPPVDPNYERMPEDRPGGFNWGEGDAAE